jgi:hypothetical protein
MLFGPLCRALQDSAGWDEGTAPQYSRLSVAARKRINGVVDTLSGLVSRLDAPQRRVFDEFLAEVGAALGAWPAASCLEHMRGRLFLQSRTSTPRPPDRLQNASWLLLSSRRPWSRAPLYGSRAAGRGACSG